MINPEKVKTLHPEGKNGVNIDRVKYEALKRFILDTVSSHPGITYQELNQQGIDSLKGSFSGSVPWYLVTVKLDLEARGMIERIPGTSPHQLRIPE